MKVTSAQANKLLKKLQASYEDVCAKENKSYRYVAAVTEDADSVKPAYDFAKTQKRKEDICAQIRRLKHSINVFNTTTVIPEFGITVDEALVYLPQLRAVVQKYDEMRSYLPKERISGYSSSTIIEYKYTNYDVLEAEEKYNEAASKLTALQLALDVVNSTVEFEIENII